MENNDILDLIKIVVVALACPIALPLITTDSDDSEG